MAITPGTRLGSYGIVALIGADADSQRFLMDVTSEEATATPLTVVINWKPAK